MKSSLIPYAVLLVTIIHSLLGSAHAQDRTEPGFFEGFRWEGRGNWTINAGVTDASTLEAPLYNRIDIFLPEGSTVEHAFLYSAVRLTSPNDLLRDSDLARPDVLLEGTRLKGNDWQRVGFPDKRTDFGTFRTDVTDLVRTAAGDVRGILALSLQEIDEDDPINEVNKLTSGEILVVLYSHPGEAERLFILYEGYGTVEDEVTIDFGQAINSNIRGFEALMSYGIANSGQIDDARDAFNFNTLREIEVNGRRLSSMGGGHDDWNKAHTEGPKGNSTFITVGGFGDKPANPADPFHLPEGRVFADRYDDELYDLAQGNGADPAAFLPNGSTSVNLKFTLENPRRYDVPFFLGLNLMTAAAPPAAELDPEPDAPAKVPDEPSPAHYREAFSWTGQGNWSISAIGKGTQGNPFENPLVAEVPPGSTVEKALLYTVINNPTDADTAPFLVFDHQFLRPGDWDRLDPLGASAFESRDHQVFRKDVTDQVRSTVGTGSDTPFEFEVRELNLIGRGDSVLTTEGEALVVIYSNPSETTRSILLVDGEGPTRFWDKIGVRAEDKIDPTAPGFEALLSLGIAGSWQNEVNAAGGSSVDVEVSANNLTRRRRLTSSAGGADDAAEGRGNGTEPNGDNGWRITVGGLGDSPDNPPAEAKHGGDGRFDDELYDLGDGFLLGREFDQLETWLRVNTSAQAHFFFGLNVTTATPLHFDERVNLPLPSAD